LKIEIVIYFGTKYFGYFLKGGIFLPNWTL